MPKHRCLTLGGFVSHVVACACACSFCKVGRCKNWGIRDHHVSRRHVEVTVPEEGEEGSREGKKCARPCMHTEFGTVVDPL